MLHRLRFASQFVHVGALGRWFGLLAVPALACCASVSAQEIVQAPGWLAIMPNDSQPVIPEVKAKGSEWFVDASRGDDFAAGTKKQPWKTLGKLKRAGLSSGDVVRLKCGSIWRESLTLDARTTPSGLTIAAEEGCGADKAPSIRGSDPVDANWQPDGAQAGAFVADRFGAVNGLAFKGLRMTVARLPNHVGPGKEFALADSGGDRRSFRLRDAERRAVGDRDLVGAAVYVRVVAWQVEKAMVRGYDAVSGTVSLDKDLSFPVKNGAGYILEGKRWMIDSPGEWWHDTQSKRLYLIPPGGQRPQAGEVEATVRDQALWVGGVTKLRVVGLDLRHTVKAAVDVQDTNDAAFEGLNIVDPGEYGLIASRSARIALRGGRIVGSGRNAVLTREAPDGLISGNLILDHGLLARADGSAAAIVVKGERTVVSGNVIRRAANPGIHFTNLEGTQIRDNVVIQPCMRMSDCGGIQTWTGHSPELATRRRMVRSVIKDNVVLGGASSLEGASGGGRNQSVGIYLDEMTGGAQVQGNVIAGTENGIYLHNAQFNDIVGNTVRSVAHASVTAHMSLPDAEVIRGNRVRGNRLFSRSTPTGGGQEVFAFKWQQRNNAERLFAGDDANEVQDNQILRAGSAGQTRWYVGESLSAQAMPEKDWRKYAKGEREQVIAVAPEARKKVDGEATANLLPDGDFRTGTTSWKAYFHPGGRGGVVEGAKCEGTPCLKFVAGHMADALSSKPFKLESATGRNDHLLKFTVKAGATGGSLRVAVRRNGPPYDNFGLDQPVVKLAPGQVFQAEVPFQASNGEPARVDFQAEAGAELYLSRASLVRVAPATNDPVTIAGSLFVINLMDKTQTVACAATKLAGCAALDEQGKEVKWPLSLAAGQSMAVFPNKKQGN